MSSYENQGIQLYTKQEAAQLLKVKVSWLERRCARRQIPFVMLSGQYRFTPEHLAEIVRLNEQPAGVSSISTERQKRRPSKATRQPPEGFVPLRPRQRRAS
ncbi:helix-turn-helix domain-containing protein [Saccharopolyspora mangrovi]|uniref:Helix-turn-helix domain-containing protein n=1 Tax=Saccharopolyspora mangrovi TaxID=3082379 RepID=A0ABU6A9B8_9PSEU|nr:helix-turn-helix domain-containing protein [Saccharopolyspora sp. S2-29]MEB3368057.1 helix-turn-helix domain-containing protein [Saccharopolyspora sp. S2-29]